MKTVSEIVSEIFPFDVDKRLDEALLDTKYDGKTSHEILCIWKDATLSARRMRDNIKLYCNRKQHQRSKEIMHLEDFLKDHPHWKILRSFEPIEHATAGIRGVIDLQLAFTDDPTKIVLVVFKRVEELVLFSDENANKPLQHLKNTQLEKCTIQLGLYAEILRSHHVYEVKRLIVLLLHPNNESYNSYFVQSPSENVEKILNYNAKM